MTWAPNPDRPVEVRTNYGRGVLMCDTSNNTKPRETNANRARFIAKAPEMLMALKTLIDELEDDDDIYYCHDTLTVRYGLKSAVERATKLLEEIDGYNTQKD